jgi:hypothetical protein
MAMSKLHADEPADVKRTYYGDEWSDHQTLLRFYEETNGPEGWKKKWPFLKEPDKGDPVLHRTKSYRYNSMSQFPRDKTLLATGVAFDAAQRVSRLRVTSNGLRGDLPHYLCRFERLCHLDLSGNTGLTGCIPDEIGEIQELRCLYFENCTGLTGEIPMSIGNLKMLRELVLSGCIGITGTLIKLRLRDFQAALAVSEE